MLQNFHEELESRTEARLIARRCQYFHHAVAPLLGFLGLRASKGCMFNQNLCPRVGPARTVKLRVVMTLQFLLRLLKFCPASVALFG